MRVEYPFYHEIIPLDPHESDCPNCGVRRMEYEVKGEYCERCEWGFDA